MGEKLIFGLGSGRSGTLSLANLLNRQPEAVCFHESNPASMAWSGAERTVQSVLNDFVAIISGGPRGISIDLMTSPHTEQNEPLRKLAELSRVEAVGDVASYYLPYVEFILAQQPGAVFPCLRRPREQTVQSFVRKVVVSRKRHSPKEFLKTLFGLPVSPRPASKNHWVEHDGRAYVADARWDKCFPHYSPELGLEEAVGRYYDEYYRAVEELECHYPDAVRIFNIDALNDAAGQAAILDFCGISRRTDFEPSRRNYLVSHAP